jgi:hypothetical protein
MQYLVVLLILVILLLVETSCKSDTKILLWKDGKLLSGVSADVGEAIASTASSDLLSAYADINTAYNREFPAPSLNPIFAHKKLMPGMAQKRCSMQEPRAVYDAVRTDKYSSVLKQKSSSVIVQAACLGDDSFGNMLSHYFETMVCANVVGAHFLTVAKIFDHPTSDADTALVGSLPDIILNSKPVDSATAKQRMTDKCVCKSTCHEFAASGWHSSKGVALIHSVIQHAVEGFMLHREITSGEGRIWQVPASSLSTVAALTALPLIPTVALHYRCGDNFVGEYGFVTFTAITSRVHDFLNSQTQLAEHEMTIYILAEKRGRKTTGRNIKLAPMCDILLPALHAHLVKSFPKAKAIILNRGGDIHVDFARLALAPVTICSVGTFCLWPALGNNNTVHYPQTKMILGGKTSANLGFSWMPANVVVLGKDYRGGNGLRLLAKLRERGVQAK